MAVPLPKFSGPAGAGGGSALARTRAKYQAGKAGSKSKTGKSECSQAVSDWKTHGMTPAVAAILGKCHARGHADAGKALDEHAAKSGNPVASGPKARAVAKARQMLASRETVKNSANNAAVSANTQGGIVRTSKPPKLRAAAAKMIPARRVGAGKDATIVMADGTPAPPHIKPSMVPPKWTDVHINPDPHGDVMVKARDAKGRTKAVYSDNFTMRTAATKFSRVHEMYEKRESIMAQVHADRRSPDPAKRDAAELTFLIERQATRPGSNTDTKAKVKAYGATTLRGEHVHESPDGVRLKFVGKEGVHHDHLVRDRDLAKILLDRKRTADQRGGNLFATDAAGLNRYIGTLDGGKFTAKDFRTLRATTLAVEKIKAVGACCKTTAEYKANVKAVAEHVSRTLGNKPQQALLSYINPTVFSVWRNPNG